MATIPSGQTTSEAIDIINCALTGFKVPAAFTGTSISFTASDSPDGTFSQITSNGASRTVNVSAGDEVTLNPVIYGKRWIKFVSSSAEGASRIITPNIVGLY